jgi:ribosome biogenesis SPOUT family RNA methylase Rps3
MQMQADGPLALTTRGLNAAVVQTAGSTTIGKSKVAVDSGTANAPAATNTFPLRIIDFVDGPDSAIGDDFTDVIVKFNAASDGATSNHQYLNATGA